MRIYIYIHYVPYIYIFAQSYACINPAHQTKIYLYSTIQLFLYAVIIGIFGGSLKVINGNEVFLSSQS